ncbi:MAG: MbnH family di-heme enzyme [Woeseiaceae bacterium]
MKRFALYIVTAAIVAVVAFRLLGDREYGWDLGGNMPRPQVPIDNPMSDVKVALGRRLFYDTRLSINGTMACASCHIQALAFTDGKARAIGATGDTHPRSSMSLVNVAYGSRLTWANTLLDRLEDQALTPLFGDNPVEMGLAGREQLVVALLEDDAGYSVLVPDAFPGDANPYSVLNAVRAIASFTRSIVSFEAPYDAFIAGDVDALSDSAIRGMDLFFSERLECFHCHGGFNFTDSTTHENANVELVGYHNNGLYNIDGNGAYPADNTGLFDMTGHRRDMGRFKAPTLRNIAVSAPYMHDGSIATLREVIEHYAAGGRGDGRLSPYKSEFIRGFELQEREMSDLIAFLEALTDEQVLTAERWSNPFE